MTDDVVEAQRKYMKSQVCLSFIMNKQIFKISEDRFRPAIISVMWSTSHYLRMIYDPAIQLSTSSFDANVRLNANVVYCIII